MLERRLLANRDTGYLAGMQAAAEAVATGRSSGDLIDEVSSQLIRVLGLRTCRFNTASLGWANPRGCATTAKSSGSVRCGMSQ